MEKKHIIVCVRRDIDPVVRDFFNNERKAREIFEVFYCDALRQIRSRLARSPKTPFHLIIDTVLSHEPAAPFIKEVRNEYPALKVMLIGSSEMKKEDLVELIQTKAVRAVLMRPFTQNDLIEKTLVLCGFQSVK